MSSGQWDFIEQAARDRFGIEGDALRKWRVRGVPARYRLPLVDLASEVGFALDRAVFDDPPGSRRAMASNDE